MAEKKSMVITAVRFKDFLILKDISIKVGSKLTRFVGPNAHGKTSMLKAIQATFKGADPSVIRKGADKSELMIEIDEGPEAGGISVARTITPASSRLTVKAPMSLPGGQTKVQTVPAAKEFLDGLITDKAFDPLQLLLLKGKERTKYFREIFKTTLTADMLKGLLTQEDIDRLDFSKDGTEVIEDLTSPKRGILYLRRTDINKTASQKKALWEDQRRKVESLPFEAGFIDRTSEIEMDLQAKKDEKIAAETTKRQVEGSQKLRDRLQKGIAEAEDQLAKTLLQSPEAMEALVLLEKETMAEIERLQGKLQEIQQAFMVQEKAEETIANLQKKIREDYGTLDALPKTTDIPDIEAIERAISALETAKNNNTVGKARQEEVALAETRQREYQAINDQSQALSLTIDKLRNEIARKITEEADIPIPDLTIDGDSIYLGGKNIDDLSTREQVDFVISIVEWQNRDKPLKTVCLDRAEVLDDEALKEFADRIPEDYRFFITIVAHDGMMMPKGTFLADQGTMTEQTQDTVYRDKKGEPA